LSKRKKLGSHILNNTVTVYYEQCYSLLRRRYDSCQFTATRRRLDSFASYWSWLIWTWQWNDAIIAIGDRMFLEMQGFNFAQILSNLLKS